MTSQNNKTKFIVAVAAFAAFLATFNETFLNVAFTPIMDDLGVTVATVQWLSTAYMLGAAVMVPVSAFMFKSVPTKRLFLITVAFLILGSIIGALAGTFSVLLVGRIVQSIGTGMLIPIGMNITLTVAPREKLGSYMGIMGAMTTLGPSLSVIIAGLLLASFNWHMLMWVFAGLSLLCFLSGATMLEDISKLTNPKLDTLSVALIGVGLIGVLYGVSTLFSNNLLIAIVSALVGIGCICVFVRRQNKLAEPLINLKPLSVKPFTVGVIINMLSLIIIFAMNIIMPIFMQSTMGASSLSASLTLFPAIILSCIVAPIAGKIYDRKGAKILLPLGFAFICAFTLAIALTKGTGSFVMLAILYIPVICGSALIIGPVQSFALSHLNYDLNPHGVTVMSTGFQIAGCIGASLFTGVYYAIMMNRIGMGAVETAAGTAFMVVGILAAVFAFVGLILAISIRRFKDRKESLSAEDVTTQNILCSIMKHDVYTINGEATLFEALQSITQKKISGLPVVDQSGTMIGFVSDGDIMRYLSKQHPLFTSAYSLAAMNSQEHGFDKKLKELINIKVKEIARKKVVSVKSDDDLGEVCRILVENKIKKAPVMDNGQMIGMINMSNIMKYAISARSEA